MALAMMHASNYHNAYAHSDENCRDPLKWTTQMKELSGHKFDPNDEGNPTQNARLVAASLAAAEKPSMSSGS